MLFVAKNSKFLPTERINNERKQIYQLLRDRTVIHIVSYASLVVSSNFQLLRTCEGSKS